MQHGAPGDEREVQDSWPQGQELGLRLNRGDPDRRRGLRGQPWMATESKPWGSSGSLRALGQARQEGLQVRSEDEAAGPSLDEFELRIPHGSVEEGFGKARGL